MCALRVDFARFGGVRPDAGVGWEAERVVCGREEGKAGRGVAVEGRIG